MKNYNTNHEAFVNCQTPESAYILGLLWADGNLIQTSKYKRISLEVVSDDAKHFLKIFNLFGKWTVVSRTRLNRRPQTCIASTNPELFNFLKEQDFLDKSKLSPGKILSLIPKNFHPFFLLGLIDGDGCFYYNKKQYLRQFSISGSYEQDWSDINKLLTEYNIICKITRKQTAKGNCSYLRCSNLQSIINLGNIIYQKPSLGLQRKYQKYLNIVNDGQYLNKASLT